MSTIAPNTRASRQSPDTKSNRQSAAVPPAAAAPPARAGREPAPAAPAAAFDPNAFQCAVCAEWGDEEDDPILCCRLCKMWVHAECYGPQYMVSAAAAAATSSSSSSSSSRPPAAKQAVLKRAAAARPAGAFTCAVCVSGLAPGQKSGACKICLRDCGSDADLALRSAKPLVTRDPAKHPPGRPSAKSAWVHITCAVWCNEAFFWDPEGKEHPDLSDVSRERYRLSCLVCEAEGAGRSGGVPVQCHRSGCGLSFHLQCARERGWETTVEDRDEGGVFMAAYCGAHSSREHLQQVAAAAEATVCEVCGKDERPGELLLCDGCDLGWHMGCATPAVRKVPEGAWFCAGCARGGGGGGGGASSSSSSSSAAAGGAQGAGAKRVRGVDAELPNTYFTHSKRVAMGQAATPAPPMLPAEEIASAGTGDAVQAPWLAAAMAADHLQLTTVYMPALLAAGVPCTVTLSSAGDSLPAAWHLATSFASIKRGPVMLVDMLDELCPRSVAGGGSGGGGGGGGGSGQVEDISRHVVSAMVVLNPAAAVNLAEWGTLPHATTDLLVLPINSPQDLAIIPQELLQKRFTVRLGAAARCPTCARARAQVCLLPARLVLTPPSPPPTHTPLQLHCCLNSLTPTPRIDASTLMRPSGRAKVQAQGVAWVLRSLTSNHRSVLKLVLSGVKDGKLHTVDTLLKQCKAQMLVRNAVELRGVVTELTDHGIITQHSGVFKLKASIGEVEAALKEK